MRKQFTAIYKKRNGRYLGWVEEVPGVNTQGRTLVEARSNLREALALILATNRLITRQEIGGQARRESLFVSV